MRITQNTLGPAQNVNYYMLGYLLFPFYTALKGEISRNIIIIKDQNFIFFMTRKVDNRYMFLMR